MTDCIVSLHILVSVGVFPTRAGISVCGENTRFIARALVTHSGIPRKGKSSDFAASIKNALFADSYISLCPTNTLINAGSEKTRRICG